MNTMHAVYPINYGPPEIFLDLHNSILLGDYAEYPFILNDILKSNCGRHQIVVNPKNV